MPEHHRAINTLIAAIPPLKGAEPLGELQGGPASHSWLVQAGGKRFVVRSDKAIVSSLGLNRHAEIEILETVSKAGIGPELIWADPARGVLVSGYIEGDAWCREDTRDPAHLRELARTLKTLHQLPPVGPAFDPAAAACRYAAEIGTHLASELAGRTARLAAMLHINPGAISGVNSGRHALCHNDLVHTNIIGHGPVWLIDWEYAAVGDPFFDLAVIVRHHDLNSALTEDFLQFYSGGVEADQRAKLADFCRLYDQLAGLWYLSMAQTDDSSPAFNEEMKRAMLRIKDSGLNSDG